MEEYYESDFEIQLPLYDITMLMTHESVFSVYAYGGETLACAIRSSIPSGCSTFSHLQTNP